jgi:hypothetical protein
MRFSLDFMLGFLGARSGTGFFMEMIMVPYRHQNKKAFLVACISSCHQTLYASDNRSELSHQSDEQHLLKACLDPEELQLGEASVQCLPVSLVCLPFFSPPIEGYISQWMGHFQGAIPNWLVSLLNVG